MLKQTTEKKGTVIPASLLEDLKGVPDGTWQVSYLH